MTNASQTSDWLINKIPEEIIKYWRKKYGQAIGCITYGDREIYFYKSDPAYYDQGGPPPPLFSDILAIGKNGSYKYILDDCFHLKKDEMIRRIKLLAFL